MPLAYFNVETGAVGVAGKLSRLEMLAGEFTFEPFGKTLFALSESPLNAYQIPGQNGWSETYQVSPPAGWKADRTKCETCDVALECYQKGGADDIPANKELWSKCSLIAPVIQISRVLGKIPDPDKMHKKPGELYAEKPLPRDAPLLTLKSKGFDVKYEMAPFAEPEPWMIKAARNFSETGELSEQFADMKRDRVTVLYKDFCWSPDAAFVFDRWKEARLAFTRLKRKEIKQFKADQCSACVYKCDVKFDIVRKQQKASLGCRTGIDTILRFFQVTYDDQIKFIAAHLVMGARFPYAGKANWIARNVELASGGSTIIKCVRPMPPFSNVNILSLEELCKIKKVDLHDLMLRVRSLDKTILAMTYWALTAIEKEARSKGYEMYLFSGKRKSRNDVLYIKLDLDGPVPVIDIGSDTRAGYHGGRDAQQKRENRISYQDRPRFHTYYKYPFFADIEKNIGEPLGSGRRPT